MCRLIKKAAFIILLFSFSMSLQAQWNKEFPVLGQYWKWGITAGPTLFNKAEISPQFGSQSFDNKSTVSFNAGVDYTFFADRRWSFLTGLWVSQEPICNIDHPDFFWKEYVSSVNFSIPLIAQMQMQVGKKVFLNLSAGYKAMYIAPGGFDFSVDGNPNIRDDRDEQLFSLSLETPNNHIYGSAIFGVGTALAMKPFLMKINLVYNLYFQNLVAGDYQFTDLTTNTRSTIGTYKMSGNYLGLMVSFYLKKPQKK